VAVNRMERVAGVLSGSAGFLQFSRFSMELSDRAWSLLMACENSVLAKVFGS